MGLKGLFKKPKLSLEGEAEAHVAHSPHGEVMRICSRCKSTIFLRELEESLYLCPECGHAFRMDARARICFLADENSFMELYAEYTACNRLNFAEYDEKLQKAKELSGEPEGVVTGTCHMGGVKTALFVMNPLFMMGSMGTVVGEKITSLFEYATKEKLPVVGVTVSGGARVQEGIYSLMQMAKTSGAVLRHSMAGLFYLVLLTDPTTGGVTASFAMEGDIILSEPKALIGFAGPRVIEQTMRQKLPEGFQTAEFLLEKGFVDHIVERKTQKQVISMLLNMHERGDAHASL